MTRIKGQKLTDERRDRRQEVRLTQKQFEMLENCADALQITKTEVIVKGIEKVNDELIKR